MGEAATAPSSDRPGGLTLGNRSGAASAYCPPSLDVTSYLAKIVESSDDAIIGKSLDGIVFSWNTGAEKLYGRTRDEMIGQSVALIVPPERRDELRRILETLRQGRRVDHIETVRVRKDGQRVNVSLTLSPILDDKGQIVGASAIARDISARKRAEEAKVEALARLRAVVETAIDGIITIDEHGVLESVNPSAARLFGYEPAAMIGQNVRMLLPEPYRSEYESYLARYLCGRERTTLSMDRNLVGLRRDGSVFPMEFAISETRWGDRVIFTGIVRDVTERRQAEESDARFRLMANSAPVLIWMSGLDRTATWFNQGWLDFTGRTMRQEMGDGWMEGVHPEDLEQCLRTYHTAYDARASFEIEFRLRRSDGEYRWLRNAGVPIHPEKSAFVGYIGSCVDVTERKSDEEALIERVTQRTHQLSVAYDKLRHEIDERRRVESLLEVEKQILELITAGAGLDELLHTLCESIQGLIPAAQVAIALAPGNGSMKSLAPARPAGQHAVTPRVFGAVAQADILPPACQERTIISAIDPSDTAHQRAAARGVRSYWFEPITAPGGAVAGTLGVYRAAAGLPDAFALSASATAARLAGVAVERADIEVRGREQLAQLAHVARLATMGEMASGLAHELNQPLCAIVNFTEACVELVNRDGNNNKQLPQALSEVAKQAERAGEVIRRLREFVKQREPVRQAANINDIVRDVVALTKVETHHSDVRVRVDFAKQPPLVYADTVQIEQVLVNLVRNACDAIRDSAAATRTLAIKTLRRRGAVEVRVIDNGPGIAAEVKDRLFEPFFTTKGDGMGMGLSISRSIVEAHEGQIWVTSNRMGGTTFHFTLPTAWRASRGRRHRVRGG